MILRAAAVLVVVGCGRIGFDPRPQPGSGSSGDAAPVCASGQVLAPVMAYDVTLSDPGDACSVTNVLALDGQVAGLDRAGSALCPSTWSMQGSCGCVAADFGATYTLSKLDVWAAPVAQACATACSGSSCGTGDVFDLLVGTSLSPFSVVTAVNLTGTTISRYSVTPPTPVAARYVAVCRQAYAPVRDDIAVDYISATCL